MTLSGLPLVRMKVLKLPQTVRYCLSKNHGVCFFSGFRDDDNLSQNSSKKGDSNDSISKKNKFWAMSSGPFSPDSTKQSQSHVCDCLWNSLFLLRLWWPFDSIQTQLPKELWKSSTSKCWSCSVKSWTADLSAKLPPKKIRFGYLDDSKIEKLRHISGIKKKIDFGGAWEHQGLDMQPWEEARDRPCTTCTSVKVFSYMTSCCLGVNAMTVLHSQNAPFLEVELYEIIIPRKGWKDWAASTQWSGLLFQDNTGREI